MCLLSKRTVKKRGKNWSREPIPYEGKRQHWYAAISHNSWFFCILMYILTVILLAIFLHLGISHLTYSSKFSDLLSLGLGTLSPMKVITSLPFPRHGTASLLALILLANVGQSILSFLYITYNNLITTMFLAHEWSSFSSPSSSPSSSSSPNKPRSLRVSQTPHGSQKSTFSLQLPYRFALPLMALSALLHWLLSQSIFLISIETYSIPFRPSSPTTIYNQ